MKKWIKRIFKWLGILLLLIIATLIIVPIVFEDDIVQMIKDTANEEVNAQIDFGEYDLSIFSSFPNLTLELNDLHIMGIDTFEGIELAGISKVELGIDLMSLMSDEYKINKIGLTNPNIHVVVLEDGTANYDIAKASTDTTPEIAEAPADSAAPFALDLDEYYIRNANIIYDDAAGNTYANIEAFTHEGSMNLDGDLIKLLTTTESAGITVDFEGVKYMNKTTLDFKADVDMDMANMHFEFKENTLSLNELHLAFNGFVAMQGDDIDMDLTVKASDTEFKNLLSMIPAVYSKEFASVKTSGQIGFESFVKGKMTATNMPAFGLDLNVDNARFQYPDLPGAVDNINIDLKVKREEGPDLDNTVVDINRFDMTIASNPINIGLHVTSPISDPNIDCKIKSQLDLSNLGTVIPMEEGEEYNGNITADLQLKGRLSALEQERYEDFVAQGQLIIMDMLYKSGDMAYDTELKTMYLNFSPQMVELSQFEAQIGKTDLSANGRIDNMLSYLFKDEELTGTFDLRSNSMDLTELMAEDPNAPAATGDASAEETAAAAPASGDAAPSEEYGAVAVPGNIRFDMTIGITKLSYPYEEGVILDLENIAGKIKVADNVAYLTDVSVDMLQGNVIMNGSYDTKDIAAPVVDLVFKVADFDIAQSAETFNTVELVAPFLKKCTGKFSTDLEMTSVLGSDFMPVYSSLTGDGSLSSKNVFLKDVDGLTKLADALKLDNAKEQNIENVKMSYEFRDGKIFVEPFQVKLFDNDAEISGSTSFEQDLDYDIDMKVDPNKLGAGFANMASSAVDKLNASGANVTMSSELPVKIKMTGKTLDPQYKVQFGDIEQGDIKEQLKEEIKEVIEEQIEEVKEEVMDNAKEQAAKLIADAEKRAATMKAETRKQAERVRKEGYDAATKIENDAKNKNIVQRKAAEKLAKKTRKQADEKADKIIVEGDAKADKVVADAKVQAAKLE